MTRTDDPDASETVREHGFAALIRNQTQLNNGVSLTASMRMLMKQGEHAWEEKRRDKGCLRSSQPSFQNGRQRSMYAKPCPLPPSPSPHTCFLPPTFYDGMETCHPKAR